MVIRIDQVQNEQNDDNPHEERKGEVRVERMPVNERVERTSSSSDDEEEDSPSEEGPVRFSRADRSAIE